MSLALEQFVDREGETKIPEPYTPGEAMIVDLAGNGKAITGLGGLAVGYKDTKEICIGVRTVGTGHSTPPLGSGSWDDPFHVGASRSWDTLLAPYSETKLVIRARSGEFEALGTNGFYLRAQDDFFGQGPGKTVLKLAPSVAPTISSSIFVIGGAPAVNGNGQWLEGFTADCNSLALDYTAGQIAGGIALAINGVVSYGDHNRQRNVDIINGWGKYLTHEHFGALMAAHTGGQGIDNIQEYVSASAFKGTYGGAIVRVGSGGLPCIGGSTSKCRVKDYIDPNGLTASTSHVGAIGATGGSIELCIIDGCQIGIYIETGDDLKLICNTLRDIWEVGIHLAPAAAMHRPKIIGNTIELRDDAVTYFHGIRLDQVAADPGAVPPLPLRNVHNADVIGNTITLKTTGHPVVAVGQGILSYISDPLYAPAFLGLGHKFIGNTIDAALALNTAPPDSYIVGNRTETGAVISALPDYSPSSEVASPVTIGTLKTAGTRTLAGGFWTFAITAADYTIVSGDEFIVEILIDPASASFDFTTHLQSSTGTNLVNTPVDQNGYPGGSADLGMFANGVSYRRRFLLAAFIGTIARKFVFGGSGTDSLGVNAATGLSTAYIASAKIVSSTGVVRRTYYSDSILAAAPVSASVANTTGNIAVPYYTAGLFANLKVAANNAAAITAGVPVGQLYRTNDDPDTVCVVH